MEKKSDIIKGRGDHDDGSRGKGRGRADGDDDTIKGNRKWSR